MATKKKASATRSLNPLNSRTQSESIIIVGTQKEETVTLLRDQWDLIKEHLEITGFSQPIVQQRLMQRGGEAVGQAPKTMSAGSSA